MHRFPLSRLLMLVMASTGLAACGGNAPVLNVPVSAANAYLLTSNNRIIGVDLDDLEYARSVRAVDQATTAGTPGALDPSEEILDIDYRNSEGTLYALTRTVIGGVVTSRIVAIAPTLGIVTRVSTLTGVTLSATDTYSIDFNPAADRLRIISSSGINLKVDVLTGNASTNGSTSPAIINGVAYTDTFTPGTGRSATLFGIDPSSDKLYTIDPNSGALNASVALGADATVVNGFDIDPSGQRDGVAILTVAGQPRIYNINTQASTNAATAKGTLFKLPGSETYKGLSLVTLANPTVLALDTTNKLYSFNAQKPEQLSAPTPVTLPNSAQLISIDYSVKDGVIYGLGSDGFVYDLTTSKSPTSAKNTTALSLGTLPGTRNTIDMSPVDGRLRLIRSAENTSSLTNLSNNTSASGGTISPTSNIAAAAYTQNYAAVTSTRLFAIDLVTNRILYQDESTTTSADMTLAQGSALNISPLAPVGFDISGRSNESLLLMAHVSNGTPFNLYQVSPFSSSPLTLIGTIGTLTNLIDIAIQQ